MQFWRRKSHWSAGSFWAAFKVVEMERFSVSEDLCVFEQLLPPNKAKINEFDPDSAFCVSLCLDEENKPAQDERLCA